MRAVYVSIKKRRVARSKPDDGIIVSCHYIEIKVYQTYIRPNHPLYRAPSPYTQKVQKNDDHKTYMFTPLGALKTRLAI